MYKILALLIAIILVVYTPVPAFSGGQLSLSHDFSRQTDGPDGYSTKIGFNSYTGGVLSLSGHYRYSKTNSLVGYDEGEFRVEVGPQINKDWGLWLYEVVGYNEQLKIDYENRVGVGVKYYFYKSVATEVSLSCGVLSDFASIDGERHRVRRYSCRPRASYDNQDWLSAKATIFHQPSMKDFNDYHDKINVEVLMKVKAFSLGPYYEYKNRSLQGATEYGGFLFKVDY